MLEGAEALVAAVDRRARVTLRSGPGSTTTVAAPDIDVASAVCRIDRGRLVWADEVDDAARTRLRTVAACLQTASQLSAGLTVEIDTTAFRESESGRKLGIGSSAAVTAALLGGLLGAADPGRVRAAAVTAHTLAQGGVGSGVDVAAAIHGGVLRYRRGRTPETAPEPDSLVPPPGLEIRAVWTGTTASTPDMVAGVRALSSARPAVYERAMRQLAELAAAGGAAYAGGDAEAFLEVVAVYHRAMAELGRQSGVDIVSAAHRAIATEVHAAGGVYKPSGAGGGDLGLACTADPDVTARVYERLTERGWRSFQVPSSERGLDVRHGHDATG